MAILNLISSMILIIIMVIIGMAGDFGYYPKLCILIILKSKKSWFRQPLYILQKQIQSLFLIRIQIKIQLVH